MIVPHLEYRPNPNRAVYVQGQINAALVQKLSPEIIALQHISRDPITVYIDSEGGSVEDMMTLISLLKATNQEGEEPCKIITVVIRNAFSAAADLLSSGDYAIAYPNAKLLYHGGRFSLNSPLTFEGSSSLSRALRVMNERAALKLAKEIEFRFMYLFVSQRSKFAAIRKEAEPLRLSDLDCLLELITGNISPSAQKILKLAEERNKRYETLFDTVIKKMTKVSRSKNLIEWEAVQLKAIIDFETKTYKKVANWTFLGEGINNLLDDFLLFQEYQQMIYDGNFTKLCKRYSIFLLTDSQKEAIDKLPDQHQKDFETIEAVKPILQPVWSFFLALCYTLQRGEDDFLTPLDCYWMGLLDEVVGDPDIHPVRLVVETQTPTTTVSKPPRPKKPRQSKAKPKQNN